MLGAVANLVGKSPRKIRMRKNRNGKKYLTQQTQRLTNNYRREPNLDLLRPRSQKKALRNQNRKAKARWTTGWTETIGATRSYHGKSAPHFIVHGTAHRETSPRTNKNTTTTTAKTTNFHGTSQRNEFTNSSQDEAQNGPTHYRKK